jgi:predicted DCC family thiol-disulfide oxidoreductase YuxK
MNVIAYYDSTCPRCTKRAKYYQRFDRSGTVTWQDVSESREGLEDSITNKRIGMLLHVQDRDGIMRKGINAYNTLWRELTNYCIIAFFSSLYSFKWLFMLAYALIWRLEWHMGKHKALHHHRKRD